MIFSILQVSKGRKRLLKVLLSGILPCVVCRGVVEWERVGTAFPRLFHVLLESEFKSCFKMASFLGAFPHLFR